MKKVFKTMAFTLLGLVLSMNLMAEATAYKTLTFPDDNSASNKKSDYTSTWTAKKGTDEWSIVNFNNNSWNSWTYIRCGRKNNKSVAAIISPQMSVKIETVSITLDVVNADKTNSIKLYTSANKTAWTEIGTYTEETGIQSVAIASANQATDLYYKVEFDCASHNANGFNQVSKVEYFEAQETPAGTVAAPTFTPATGKDFYPTLSVTLAQKDSKTIYYTTNTEYTSNEEVFANGTEYSSAINLEATTTIQAVAIDGDNISDIANATYTKITPLSTMGDIFNASATAGDYYITFNNWVISGVKGSNAYLTDNAGNGLIIYISNHGFVAGDILSGTVKCALKKYNGSAEITNLTSSSEGLMVTKGGPVTAVEKSIKDLSGVNTGALVNLGTLTYNGSDVFSDGTNTIKAYNSIMTTLPSWTSGLKYTVQGIYIQFNTTQEIAPRDANDIVEKSADKFNITIADGIQNGSVSVQGGKTQAAEDEEVVLTIAPADNYKLATLTVDGSDVTTSVVDNKYTFSMPGHAVTISATFEAKKTFTITWKVKGVSPDATTLVTEGETLSLPIDPEFSGYKFIGWTANAIEGKQSTPPTLLANNTTPTESKTYYAVFAVVTGQDPLEGNYTLNYDPDVKDKTLGYGNAVDVTAEDGSEWVVKAFKNSGMQINTGKSASIKIPTCPANISTIEITCSAAKAVGLSETDYSGSETITYLAVGTDAKSQTIDLTKTEFTATTGYIVAKSGSTSITKVVVNYSGTKDHLDNYTTNPTAQVKVKFDLNGGTGTFNDASIDEGDDYTVTSETPIAPEGYEFDGWMYNETKYVGGNKIENITSDITLTAQYKKAWYAVSDASTSTEGSVTIATLTEGKAEFEATVTLTPQAKTGFAFSAIEAYKTGEDATKIELTPGAENTYTFSMPAYAVTVKATFIEAASACDINFYVAGALAETASATRGQEYSITQTGATFDGFTFVGWATQEYTTEQADAIETVASITPPTGSEEAINLYAVYKRAAVEAAYEKVTAEPTSWVGQYLFVYEDNTTPVALDGSLETIDGAKDTIQVTITDGKILSSAKTDASAMTIEEKTDGYAVKSAAGYYIYASSYKNDMSSQKNYQDKCKVEISLENGITQTFTEGAVTIKYNKSAGDSRFRFYKSGQQPISYFKLGEASYVYTTSPVVKYTISYDLNGGSKGEGNFDEQQVVKGSGATVTGSVPTKTGYTFVNWKDADNNTYNSGATITNVQKDINLVAQYNVNKYVVTHTATNGAINVTNLDAESKAEYGATLTISLEPESGYEIDPTIELKAYKTGDESIPVSITDNTITMPDYAITIVAGFRAETPEYTIIVQSNNTEQGTVSIFEETETTLSLKEDDVRTILAWPNKGYRFVNWTTEDDITIADADDDETTFTVKTSGATITANFEAIPSVTYTKITTTDDLAYNDKVIIVAATADRAMSATQNTNNRGGVAITRGDAGATITLATDEVAVLDVLSGNAAQTFAFHDANGYLYAASSSNNYMKSENKLDANGNGNWNITISEGSATIVAQGTNTHNLMLYNVGSKLFSCYADNTTVNGTNYQYVSLYRIASEDQVLVTLKNGEEVFARYRANKNSSITLNGFTPDVEGKTVVGWTDGETVYVANAEITVAETNLTLNIAFAPDFTLENKTAGALATICLPKKIAKVENATLYSISYGNTREIEFVEADFANDAAGMPYLVQVAEDGDVKFFTEGEAVDTPVSAEDAKGFVGKLADDDPENPIYVPSDGSAILISGGQLRIAGAYCVLTKNHAYITTEYLPTEPEPVPGAPRRTITLRNPDAAPTNLNGLNGNMKAQKVMKDGQFYIIREAKMYNAQGIEVQ